MAEHAVVRDAPLEGCLERIDLIDTLAGEGPLAQQILIKIRGGGRIGVYPAGCREQALEEGALPAHRQGRRDTGLKDAIPLHDALAVLVESGIIQRMRHLGDQLACGPAREASVRIQRDHIAYPGRYAFSGQEGGVVCTAQQAIELM